jgi:hypothetical protein
MKPQIIFLEMFRTLVSLSLKDTETNRCKYRNLTATASTCVRTYQELSITKEIRISSKTTPTCSPIITLKVSMIMIVDSNYLIITNKTFPKLIKTIIKTLIKIIIKTIIRTQCIKQTTFSPTTTPIFK